MFKHLWVKRGMLSGLTKKTCILVNSYYNEPILSFMLAAGIVQDTFAGKAGEGERVRRSGEDWRLLLPPGAGNSSRFVAIDFYRIRSRVLETYVRMYTCENLGHTSLNRLCFSEQAE